MDKYTYRCNNCSKVYRFPHLQSYKKCNKCKSGGQLLFENELEEGFDNTTIDDHDDLIEMPEGGWECSECGAPVNNMNDVCSQSCFNAMMR